MVITRTRAGTEMECTRAHNNNQPIPALLESCGTPPPRPFLFLQMLFVFWSQSTYQHSYFLPSPRDAAVCMRALARGHTLRVLFFTLWRASRRRRLGPTDATTRRQRRTGGPRPEVEVGPRITLGYGGGPHQGLPRGVQLWSLPDPGNRRRLKEMRRR